MLVGESGILGSTVVGLCGASAVMHCYDDGGVGGYGRGNVDVETDIGGVGTEVCGYLLEAAVAVLAARTKARRPLERFENSIVGSWLCF